jgi:hypothetical protein
MVGLSIVVPFVCGGLLYTSTTSAPIYPQPACQNSFSGIIWYLFQKLHGRIYKGRGFDGRLKPVSANIMQGQMLLAMEKTGLY